MLKFLKKNREAKLTKRDFEFLSVINDNLKTHDFSSQINSEFIIGKRTAMLTEREGSYSYQFDGNLENEYFQRGPERFFEIKDIRARSYVGRPVYIELYIMQGVILGYFSDTSLINIDLESIDTSYSYENHGEEKLDEMAELTEILGSISTEILSLMNTNSTFKIEVDNKEYYVIKDFEDGNYMSVDTDGKVFGMVHDPYTVEELFDHSDLLYKAIIDKSFSPESYIEQKLQ